MDKLKNIIKYNKRMMIFMATIVIIGVISGSILCVILSSDDKKAVIESVQSFNTNIVNNSFDYVTSIKNVFIPNILITLLIWLLGISIIGALISIGLLFWKAFTLGFSISSFVLAFNFKGILICIFYIFPLIINLLIFMYMSTYSTKLSIVLIKSIIGKQTINFKRFINNYVKVLLVSIIVIIISGLYEVFINPYILKNIINLLF